MTMRVGVVGDCGDIVLSHCRIVRVNQKLLIIAPYSIITKMHGTSPNMRYVRIPVRFYP